MEAMIITSAKRFALLIGYRHVLEPEPDASLVSAKQMVNQMISCLLTLGSYCKLLVFLIKKRRNGMLRMEPTDQWNSSFRNDIQLL